MTTVVGPSRNEAPRTVRLAVLAWAVAVGAGVFETIVVVLARVASADASSDGGLGATAAQAAVRGVLLGAALWTALRLLDGRRWARLLLAVLLGGLGLASLLVDPALWLARGGSWREAVPGPAVSDWLFAGSRAVHVAAVVAAVVLMFRPSSNAFFRLPATGGGPDGGNADCPGE